MEKEIVFVLLDEFADWEAAFLAPALCSGVMPGRPGSYAAKYMSPDGESVRSIGGLRATPDYDASTLPESCAGLILVGGMQWESAAARRIAPLAGEALKRGILVGAICNAVSFMAANGLLNGVRHTGNTVEMLKQWGGANYTGEALYEERQAVRDGNVVTANGTGYLEFTRECLLELDRETNLRVIQPRMLSGHIQGRLLEMLVRMLRPRRVLEIGTFTGYSALCMAAGLEGEAELHTVEVEDELEELAQSFFDRSAHGSRIRLHIGSALDIAPALGGVFDLVFIDGDKREYPDYYRMLMGDDDGCPLVRSGSVLIADNILWSGKVVQPVAHNDRHTQALVEFNRMVREDPRVENVIVPLRDGLNLIRIK